MSGHQRIYAAVARSRDAFCVAVVEPDTDDPYTFLLTYDAAFPQPWGRTDMRRVINAVTVHGPRHVYAALSGEGDVYLLEPQGPVTEKIPGAGIFSGDAAGLGSLLAIADIGGTLYASGNGSQFYRRDAPGVWTSLGGPALPPPAGYSDVSLKAIAGQPGGPMYLCGSITPAQRQLTQADYAAMAEAGQRGDTQRILEIAESVRDPGRDYTIEGAAFTWRDGEWSRITLPGRHGLHDVLFEAPDRVWLVGFHGTILRGDVATGFQTVGFHGDTDRILSFTPFEGRYAAASDNALHWFNGHNLSPIRPSTVTAVLTPLKVQAVDDVLFYIDYKQGVHRFDGAAWTEIPIPPELLERSFPGLPKP